MNKVMLLGRLTKDPESRIKNPGSEQLSIASFSLAVDRKGRKGAEQTTDFFDCTSFGKQAEFVEKYLKKGTKILLSGRIENNNYTNKEGQKVYATRIVCEEIDFAESKGSGAASAAQSGQKASGNNAGKGEFVNIPMADGEEEFPFSF